MKVRKIVSNEFGLAGLHEKTPEPKNKVFSLKNVPDVSTLKKTPIDDLMRHINATDSAEGILPEPH